MGDILHRNEGLLGILLGFGKHNAMLFQRREDLLEKLEEKKICGLYNLEPIQNELQQINSKLQTLREHDFYIISSLNRVCFVADHKQQESKRIKEKYDELNVKINEIYSREDWFKQTLLQLISK